MSIEPVEGANVLSGAEPARKAGSRLASDALSIILEATADLNGMLAEPDRLYASLLERLERAVPFFSGSLQVIDSGVSRIVALRGGLNPDVVLGIRFELNPLFPNFRVVETRKPVAFNDIRDEYPMFYTHKDQFNSEHIRSWLGVPLVVAGSVIGMITLDRDVVDPFEDDEIKLVQGFADSAAVAFRNAQLYGQLQDALAAQHALMREMHHRVKNNLQLVNSLIAIHASRLSEESARQNLGELQVRIRSISAIHESLYERTDMSSVDLDEYLVGIVRDVFQSFSRPGSGITLEMDMSPVHADPSAVVPLGLIAGELIINALKYAFPDDSGGSVRISLRSAEAGARLMVEDTGIGFALDDSEDAGFGTLLIRTLAEQIGGKAELESRPGRSAWTISFPYSSTQAGGTT